MTLEDLLTEGASAAIRIQERMNEAAEKEAPLYGLLVDRWPAELLPMMSALAPRHRIVERHEFECAFVITRERAHGFGARVLNASVTRIHRLHVARQSRIRLTVVQTPCSRLESSDGSQQVD
jgi:hypothetical protein